MSYEIFLIQDEEVKEEKAEAERTNRIRQNNEILRDSFRDLKELALRRMSTALTRVDSAKYPEAALLLESTIQEIERMTPPPVE